MKLPPIDPEKDGTDSLAQARAIMRYQRERNEANEATFVRLSGRRAGEATMREKARRQAFAHELVSLMLKHGVTIEACGCCGSPWLTVVNPQTLNDSALLEGEILGSTMYQRLEEDLR